MLRALWCRASERLKPALIVNENFPVPALRVLRSQGVDVLSVQETMPVGTDEAVLAMACETRRWLVTFDRDNGELVFSRKCAPPQAILYLRPLVYLGRYLYRGVIQERDTLACENDHVRFRYRDGKTGKRVVRTVSGAFFLHLVLQHVLPKGFRRARNYGFLHPNSKRLIALLQVVLKAIPCANPTWMKPRPPFVCPCCGAPMRVVRRRMAPPWVPRLCCPCARSPHGQTGRRHTRSRR